MLTAPSFGTTPVSPANVAVTTAHYNNARTGLNQQETTLTPGTVNPFQFGRLYNLSLSYGAGFYDFMVQGQPLYVPAVVIPGKGTHNVVYVATQYFGHLCAFDADSPQNPLWVTSLVNESAGDMAVDGVTATPVIDLSTNTIFADSREMSNGHAVHFLHALDLGTGQEKFGAPIRVTAGVAGTGTGSSGGILPFTENERNRPAILLSNGVVYLCYGAYEEHPDDPSLDSPYHGWVIGYDAKTLRQTFAWCATPDGEGGGIWMSGGGPVADSAGYIYVITGDGTFTAASGGRDYGDSFVKLSPASAAHPVDYATPSNQGTLNTDDLDLGSGGPILIPTYVRSQQQIVGQGKDGVMDFLNSGNLGGYSATPHFQAQTFGTAYGNFSTFAYWNGLLYTCGVNDHPRAYRLGSPVLPPAIATQASATFGYSGATPVISANGNANGIAWFLDTSNSASGGPAVLHAYDATDLTRELWNSNMNPARDTIFGAIHFSMPVVTNGKVFIPSNFGVSVFGLLPVLYGDLDGNGAVDIRDVRLMLQQAAGLASVTNRLAGDVATSGRESATDGKVTLLDAVRVLRYIQGTDPTPLAPSVYP